MKKPILVILLLILLPILFYSSIAFSTKIFSQKDNLVRTYPFRITGVEMFKKGEFPFWTPYILCGAPLLANMEMALCYPLYFFDFFLPPVEALKYNTFFHLILGGVFMYLYLRVLRLCSFGALIGAFAFIFGGYIQVTMPHPPLWAPMVYLPLLFLLFELGLQTNKKRYMVLAGLILSLQILSSVPQIVYYSLFGLGLYAIFRTMLRESGENILSPGVSFICLVSIGFLLSAFQLIPTYEYYLQSVKYHFQVAQDASGLGAMLPHAILFFIGVADPSVSGFIGISGLLLGIVGIISGRNKFKFFFTGLCLLVLVSILEITRFYKILFYIPGFNMFNSLHRFVSIYAFGISILAGFGGDILSRIMDRENQNLKKRISLIFLIIAGILIIAFVLNYFFKDRIINYGENFIEKKVFAQPGHPFPLDYYYQKLKELYNALSNVLGLAILPVIAIFILILLRGYGKIRGFIFQSSLIIIILLELYSHWNKLNWKLVDPNEYYQESEAVSFIKKDTSLYRVFGLDSSDRYHFDYENSQKINDLLIPNLSLIHNVQDPQGMNNFTLWNYWKVLNIINKNKFPLKKVYSRDPFHVLAITDPYHHLIDLLNVKYLLTYTPIKESDRWKLIFDKGVINVYQNKKVFPRAFISYNYKVAQDEGEILQLLANPDFNLKETVVLGENINHPVGPHSENRVEITKYSPLEVKIDIYTENPGILVLCDSFYPGWRAKVDSKYVEILQAYSIFRAIPIPQGSYRVTFKYFPLSFICGCFISIITLFFIILEGIRRSIKFNI